MSNLKKFEETIETIEEIVDYQMEVLIAKKQELEEEINCYEEDDTSDLQEELKEINKQISKLSKIDSFEMVDEMYGDDEAFLTNDIFEN